MLVALRHDSQDASLARLNLLHIRYNLLVQLVVSGYKDDRHVLVDKGYRAVLHLGSRITLGMYVAYLLELERTLQGYGVVEAASKVQKVVGVCEHLGKIGYLLRNLEFLLHLCRNLCQLAYKVMVFVVGECARLVSQCQCKER